MVTKVARGQSIEAGYSEVLLKNESRVTTGRGNGNSVQARFELLRLVGILHEELEVEGNLQRRKRVGLLVFILPSFPRKWKSSIAKWVQFGGA